MLPFHWFQLVKGNTPLKNSIQRESPAIQCATNVYERAILGFSLKKWGVLLWAQREGGILG